MQSTLSINKPFGKTIGLTLIFLLFSLGLLEISLRANALQPYLNQLAPSLGGRHHQMELQLARLELLADKEGSVDWLTAINCWLLKKPGCWCCVFLRNKELLHE